MGAIQRFSERLTLALLRRIGPRADDDFAARALYVAGHPVIERQLDRMARDGLLVVEGGPFKGMRIPRRSGGPPLIAKAFGTYEAQIAPVVERIVGMRPPTIVNVGCSDGYYLVGLAMRLPSTRCIGYDISAEARADAQAVATLNGIEADIRAEATAQTLRADLIEGTVLLVDIEGAELNLLDPAAIPQLAKASILVETHDLLRPNTTATLRERFALSHDVAVIPQVVALPECADLRAEILRLRIAHEHRGDMQYWLWMTPRVH